MLSAAGAGVLVAALTLSGSPASASVVAKVQLGTAEQFGVLAGSTVTNVGNTLIAGIDLGVSPGTAITGFPPGEVLDPGVKHIADGVAGRAKNDATTAYNQAAGLTADNAVAFTELGGKTLEPGVYQGNLSLTGTVTLDNSDDPDAVFVFQASSTLITASSSVVAFTNPDHPSCNVFWQVGSSATLGTDSTFVGTIVALASISAGTSAAVQGRLVARTGAVTLDSNAISRVPCATPTTTTTPPTTTSSSTKPPTTPPSSTKPPTTPPSSTKPPTTPKPPTTRSVPTTTTVPRDITTGQSLTIIVPSTTTSAGSTRSTTTRPTTTSPTTETSTQVLTSTEVYGGGTTDYSESTESTEALGIDTGSGGTLANTGPAQVRDLLALGLSLLGGGLAVLFFAGRRLVQPGRHRQV